MNHMEKKLSQAMEHATPDVLEDILSSANDSSVESSADMDLLFAQSTPRRFTGLQKGLCAAAALVVCFGAVLLSGRLRTQEVPSETSPAVMVASSIVMLDVNPSFRMDVTSDETVASVSALNDDATAVLGSMKLENVSLEVALNALMGSMFQHGYLNDLQNSILVSVENPDTEAGDALRTKITAAINSAVAEGSTQLAVLSQTVPSVDTSLEALAEQYQISVGKASLIQEAIAQDATLSFENLAAMSINDIALIIASRGLTGNSVTQSGTSSTKEYISQEEALSLALADAGVTADAVQRSRVEFDSEDGTMIYEVEFYTASGEYEYDINARSGELLKIEKPKSAASNTPATQPLATTQPSPDSQPVTTPQTPAAVPDATRFIGEAAAKTCALADAGYQETDVVYINAYIDYDDGIAEHYDVEFVVGNTGYEYKIDLYQSVVLGKDIETRSGTHHPESNHNPEHSYSYIDEATAKSIALTHAQVTEDTITNYKIKLDYNDHHVPVYEIEFDCGYTEYEYDINAQTGAIEDYDMDIDD